MGGFIWLLAGLVGVAVWCTVVLLRRDRGRYTENVDGLMIEQQALLRARGMRGDVRAFTANVGRPGRKFGSHGPGS
ncbi:hypothetical protein [Streptomyces albus]|uniref:hypothetical protein n=1 Tax=Streptomyces albus TaxID=1888 RepID=UPI000567E7F0|nr:hypothetical protein [Streptomyces albus]